MAFKYPETLEGVRKLFGKNLRRIRLSKNLFQKEVADIYGVSATNIYAMEKGVYGPSTLNLCILANCLGVDIGEFFKPCSEIVHRDLSARKLRGNDKWKKLSQ